MGWFDEQIKQKVKNDDEAFSDALMRMSGVIMGQDNIVRAMQDDRTVTIEAIRHILNFYHVKPREIPDSLKEMDDILEYLMRPSGFMRRRVSLTSGWYKDCIGAMLTTYKKSGKAVALIPLGTGGYEFIDEDTGKKVKVTDKNEHLLSDSAICFYRPLPLKAIDTKELIKYILQTLSGSDYVSICVAAFVITLLGMLTPYANNLMFAGAEKDAAMNVPVASAILLAGVAISRTMVVIIRELIMAKIKTKMSISVESASMMRLLSLPAGFFKKYSSGELACRIQDINGVCGMIIEAGLGVFLYTGMSLIYLVQIYIYAPELMGSVVVILLMIAVFGIITTITRIKVSQKSMEMEAKTSGLVYALFSGIQKIKLAGAERRAFAKWAEQYRKSAEISYHPPLFIRANQAIEIAVSLGGSILLYYRAANAGMSVENFVTFQVAFSMISGAFISMTSMSDVLARIQAILSLAAPVLSEVPEVSEDKKVVTRLSGGIELNNVSFRYKEDMPLIINNLSMRIRQGQYVAIVGKTGCGKSTLMRLMLGFEKPQKGAVYYDGKDLSHLDLKSLRKYMGVVMQNGKIFQGSIYSNIVISAPWLSVDDAWKAAEMSGIASDIREMPMGMDTIIAEGGGGFSGGQKQRLMIARAIAAKPKILLFDEATSALDNITQKQVSDALAGLKCTRIVIAHRLSTIKECDRIVVLDNGQIIEDGKYEDLVQKNGFFAELVERQKVV